MYLSIRMCIAFTVIMTVATMLRGRKNYVICKDISSKTNHWSLGFNVNLFTELRDIFYALAQTLLDSFARLHRLQGLNGFTKNAEDGRIFNVYFAQNPRVD